jgi:hypothetical protein
MSPKFQLPKKLVIVITNVHPTRPRHRVSPAFDALEHRHRHLSLNRRRAGVK